MSRALDAKPFEDVPVLDLSEEAASELEKAEAIRDVMEHAVRVTRAVALAKEMKSWPLRPLALALVAVMSVTLGVYTFTAQADWAYGPDPASVPALRHDAHVRFAMYLTSQRLIAHQAATGVLPETLAELGEEWPGVEYVRADSSFTLRARAADGAPITLEPAGDLKAFLADSRLHLRERRP